MPSELQKSRNFSMPLAVATTDGPFHTHKPCTVLDPCAAAEPRQPSTRAINNVAVRSRALEPIIELLSTSCLQLYPSFARTGENLAISSARVIDSGTVEESAVSKSSLVRSLLVRSLLVRSSVRFPLVKLLAFELLAAETGLAPS